jgi:hypothetical protein
MIHIQSLTNLSKFMWKFVINVVDVIFEFGNFKRKTHKVHMNNDPCKAFKYMGQYSYGLYENIVKF